ncbi:MAG: sulfatase-like hydrolase/transferase [Planctomycetes bacterium]|nr:sulfatase-like hydrolase/transferase [Planctomycetota bacterium]
MKTAKTKITIFILLIVIAAIAGFIVYRHLTTQKIRNIIIISMDTTRADFISAYGKSPVEITPNIDALASEGVLCENAISPIPFTLPAHASMMTGTIPAYHGVLDNSYYKLSEENVTLAERLKEKGFVTAAFVSTFILKSNFGLDQGFDIYEDDFTDLRNTIGINERRAEETTAHAIEWLVEHKDEKNFIFVHYYDPHYAYDAPEPFGSKFKEALSDTPQILNYAAYAGEIAYTDHCIGKIIEKLKELDLYDSTLICVTSDHGESLREHKENTHGFFIYRPTAWVPLIFKIPGLKEPVKIENRVGIVDIVPTICSLLGIKIKEPIQGKDLTAYYKSDSNPYPDRHIFSQSQEPTKYKANSLLGITTDKYKYIQTTRPELYDLEKDPYQELDIIADEPHRARLMKEKLKEIIEETVLAGTKDARVELDAETLERLESLGYVGGAVEEGYEFDQTKEDPKDLITYHVASSSIGVLIIEKEYDQAKKTCQWMISERPDLYKGYHGMAKVLYANKEYNEAIGYYLKAIEVDPNQTQGYSDISKVYKEMDDLDNAIKYARKTLELNPKNIEGYFYLSTYYIEKNMDDMPQKLLTQVLLESPLSYKAAVGIVNKLIGKKEIKRAYQYCSYMLKLDQDSGYALNALAWFQSASEIKEIRNPDQALKYAIKACEITKNQNVDYLDTLAVAYAATGDFKKAIKTAEQAAKLADFRKKTALAEGIKDRIELFKAGKSYLDQSLKIEIKNQ